MQLFEVLLLLVAVAVGLGMLAEWLRIPYPIMLVVGGLLLSFQPNAEPIRLEPDVMLLLVLPPLLYAGAFNTYWPAFRAQLRAISLLAIGCVLFTMSAIAWVGHDIIGLPWAAAFVLGAIVSPPDAVAAMSITRLIRVPRIVSTILEGESLVNDASALVAFRLGVACVIGGTFSLAEAATTFVLVSAGGIAIGLLGAWLAIAFYRWIEQRRLADTKLTITITLLTPYAVYFPAEHLHVSGVLAVVAAGLWVGSRCERIFPEELYREAKAVWEWLEFLLNAVVFIMVGSQLRLILEQLSDEYTFSKLLYYIAAVTAATIVARVVWVFPGAYLPRMFDRHVFGVSAPYPPWQTVAVVSWTGMRGVVSLAAAMALPPKLADGTPFPGRDIIQVLTFWVIFATLVGQGLTLPLLIRLLGVDKLAAAEPPEEGGRC